MCLTLASLFGIIPPPSSAQQNQSEQQSTQEIEALKQRVSELEKQLQTVENVEKMELQAKLAEANAKLANAEFGKFERDLRDANDSWLIKWGIFALTFLAVVGAGALAWVRSRTNQLITDRVEKSLNGFKDALQELGIMKNQLSVLEKEHTASKLEGIINFNLRDKSRYPEKINALREDALLDVFVDEIYHMDVKFKAAEVLAFRKSSRLVSPMLEYLNSFVNSSKDIDFEFERHRRPFANLLGQVPTLDAYDGLTRFLNRLLTENPIHKDLFLQGIVFSLADISLQLNKGNSAAILKKAVPHLNLRGEHEGPIILAQFFDRFNESKGIEDLLNHHGASLSSDVLDRCLELLQKHNREFVEKWRAENTTDDTES